jgi:FtsH-binding integral membrane protein
MARDPSARFTLRAQPQARAERMTGAQAYDAGIDTGLRSYMLKVYNYMALGVAMTGAVAFAVATSPALMQAIFGTGLMWVFMLAPLGVVFYLSARINHMSATSAQMWFWVLAALYGVMFSVFFVAFTGTSIARVFFITAGAFAALSLYGYTTKRDLTAMGSFLIVGAVGLMLAIVVNWFIESSALQLAISVIGVLIFAGLTAYDTQKVKSMYVESDGDEITSKKAVMGALTLYIDFIMMFQFLMHLMGNQE